MGRFANFKKMLSEKRCGFSVDEVMTGTHHFEKDMGPEGKFFMEFQVTWGNKHVSRFLNPYGDEFLTNNLNGTVTIDKLVENAECEGKLELKYFSEAKIRYNFDFEDKNGKEYHFVGEKINIRPWNLHRTHTTCYGVLTELETNKVISKSITYFKFKTLPAFILSMRLE